VRSRNTWDGRCRARQKGLQVTGKKGAEIGRRRRSWDGKGARDDGFAGTRDDRGIAKRESGIANPRRNKVGERRKAHGP
jgi:hypothetical protein